MLLNDEFNEQFPHARSLGLANAYARVLASIIAVTQDKSAGEVVEVGAGVTRVKVGDKVAGCFFQRWSGGEAPADVQASALGGTGASAQFSGSVTGVVNNASGRPAVGAYYPSHQFVSLELASEDSKLPGISQRVSDASYNGGRGQHGRGEPRLARFDCVKGAREEAYTINAKTMSMLRWKDRRSRKVLRERSSQASEK